MRTTRAFTLLELILSMAVAMLIIGIAVLSIGSVGREQTLRSYAGVLEATARASLQEAVRTGNPVSLHFDDNTFSVGEKSHLIANGMLEILRPGDRGWNTPLLNRAWTFHPSGICEPIGVRITNKYGKVEIHFDPLTAAAASTDIEVFSDS